MKNINLIYFSPTGTSKKVVQTIGKGLGTQQIREFDITPATFVHSKNIQLDNELTLIGLPVYKGRVPVDVLPRLKKFRGNNTPVVLVALYGNREFDDALLELKNLVIELGFIPLAAAAFIGEHSYSTELKPIAKNRPDETDLAKAKDFSRALLAKLKDTAPQKALNIPGNYPYKTPPKAVVMAPSTVDEKCTLCGICADVCPVNVIKLKESVETHSEACIWCCACVKACPEEARIFETPTINKIKDMLFKNFSERKEPEFFI